METVERTKEERVKMPYKLIDRNYYIGDLWDFIGKDNVKDDDPSNPVVVVGLDFGHGECMVYKRYRQGSKWFTVPLYFDDAKNQKLMTAIRYGDNGFVTIGKEVSNRTVAAHGGHILPYFKVPPSQWKNNSGLRDSFNKEITNGTVIRDFLRALWDRALKFDQIDSTPSIKKAAVDDRLLVAMGCPASSEWTNEESMKQLKELLQEVTGCNNVAIMPEPKAALMAPIVYSANVSNDWKARLTALMTTGSGICIYDLGSSTIDFTYVRLGKVLITRSKRIGGSDLDTKMLERAEQKMKLDFGSNGKRETWNIRDENKLYLREAKEKYYDDISNVFAVLQPVDTVKDADNQNKGSSKVAKVNVEIDSDFMQGVVGSDSDKDSWYQSIHKFFESTQGDVITYLGGTLDDFNGLIILTGGTSHVTEVRKICADVWRATEENPFDDAASNRETNAAPNQEKGHAHFTVLKDPSSSVATGLVFAKSTEYEAAARFQGIRADLNASYESAYDRYVTNLSSFCAGVVLKYFKEAVGFYNDNQPHKIEKIVNKTSALIRESENFSDEHMQKIMDVLLGVDKPGGEFARCQQDILDKVNAFAGDIYGGELNERIALSKPSIGEDVRFFLSNAVTSALIKTVSRTVMQTTLNVLATLDLFWSILKSVIPFMNNRNDKPTLVQKKLNTPLTPQEIQGIALKLNQEKQKIQNAAAVAAKDLITEMDSKDMKDPYFQMLDAQLEVAIGKILFLVYDKSDCK